MTVATSSDADRWRPLIELDDARIITLAPGQDNDPLSCTLHEINLDSLKDEYIALSYAWNGAELDHAITCSDQPMPITHSLHSALKRLRHSSSSINIWCDALCIRQGHDSASLLERSHQITLMSRIFSSAKCVVVELGDDDGTLASAKACIDAIIAIPIEVRDESAHQESPSTYLGLPPFADATWQAFWKLFSRGYYHRLWTVQEIVLAAEVRVMFGCYEIGLDHLVSAAAVLASVVFYAASVDQMLTHDMFTFSRRIRAIGCLLTTWRRRNVRLSPETDSPGRPLVQLLDATMKMQCTDLRDKIYALYGMAEASVVGDLPVSYKESVEDLGIRASLYFIDKGYGVWTLVFCGGLGSNRSSWSLNLRTLGIKEFADPLTVTTQSDGTNEAYSAGGHPAPSIKRSPNGRNLEVTGAMVDGFESMPGEFVLKLPTDALLGLGGTAKGTAQYTIGNLKTLQAAAVWAREFSPADDDEFWRTLIANHNAHEDDPHREENGRALPGFGTYFHELMAWVDDLLAMDPPFDVEDVSPENMARLNVPYRPNKYWGAITPAYLERRIVRCTSGKLALVPEGSQMSDAVAVFRGVPVPFVLRETDEGVYSIVGICYVHGLMEGQAMDGDTQLQDIVLV
jgi:hypothetical protein